MLDVRKDKRREKEELWAERRAEKEKAVAEPETEPAAVGKDADGMERGRERGSRREKA